ncbi:27490_t:CDS:2 [Racocetra persica]|uniref:27490_t:CDS:1 n=1 Tax=Racocetra persica TaxID=160502 RepID=A0ACA9M1A6_9GLOM|nr:27490_t:CDS:2 [Racocetra persica]
MAHPLLIKILNVLAYIFLLSANIYSVFEGNKSNSPYHEAHKTYISPAPFVFGVWGLIHFLLGGFVIYQFFPGENEVVVEGINWHFIGISLLNALWLALWEANWLIISFIAILFTSFQISYVYGVLKKQDYAPKNLIDQLLINVPFSLYHAWIAVILTLSFFAIVTPEKTNEEPILLVKIVVVIALLILKSLSATYIEAGDDISGAIVIAWTLIGIFVEQEDLVIHWTALVLAVFSILHIIKGIIFLVIRRNRTGGEYTALNNP